MPNKPVSDLIGNIEYIRSLLNNVETHLESPEQEAPRRRIVAYPASMGRPVSVSASWRSLAEQADSEATLPPEVATNSSVEPIVEDYDDALSSFTWDSPGDMARYRTITTMRTNVF